VAASVEFPHRHQEQAMNKVTCAILASMLSIGNSWAEETIGQSAAGAGRAVKDTAVEVGHAAKDAAVGLGTTVKDTAVTVGKAAKETAIEAGHSLRDSAKEAGQAVKTGKLPPPRNSATKIEANP
jgi:hypothetical protein